MAENLALQTANQMVDTLTAPSPNPVENAYQVLASKFQSDAYGPSQSGSQFLNDVMGDIKDQYTGASTVSDSLAYAWANQNLGKELPADGFNQQDLEKVELSTDSSVTVLDKYLAQVLLNGYPDLQKYSQAKAEIRINMAQECVELTKNGDDLKKELGGTPAPGTLGALVLAETQCKDPTIPGDQQRAAGVIRQIPAIDIQSKLKGN